jgi:hypothetical protein
MSSHETFNLNAGSRWPGQDQVLKFAKAANDNVATVTLDRKSKVGTIVFGRDVTQSAADDLVVAINANRSNWSPDKLYERARLISIVDSLSSISDLKAFLKKLIKHITEGDRIT